METEITIIAVEETVDNFEENEFTQLYKYDRKFKSPNLWGFDVA